MKFFLRFINKQVVRISWGYNKLFPFIGLVNTTAYIITALAVSGLVEITWKILMLIFFIGLLSILMMIYSLSKLGILQDENIQLFHERHSKLWKQTTAYNSLMTAYYLNMSESDLLSEKKILEKQLFLRGNNNE